MYILCCGLDGWSGGLIMLTEYFLVLSSLVFDVLEIYWTALCSLFWTLLACSGNHRLTDLRKRINITQLESLLGV